MRTVSDPNAASPMREEAIRKVQESIAASAPHVLEDLGDGWQLTRVFSGNSSNMSSAEAVAPADAMDLLVFHAGLDQNSAEVGGGAACSVCSCALAQWLLENEGELPVTPGKLDDIVRLGVSVWQELRQSPAARAQFPDGHFDLDFALKGLARRDALAGAGLAEVVGEGRPPSSTPEVLSSRALAAEPRHSFIGFLSLPDQSGAGGDPQEGLGEPAASSAGNAAGDEDGDGDSGDVRDERAEGVPLKEEESMGRNGSRSGPVGDTPQAGPLSGLRELLKGSLGVEDLWSEMAGLAPAVFVVAWHDHFFTLALRASGGAAVVDSLGSRLHDGNDSAYVIDFPAGSDEPRPYARPSSSPVPPLAGGSMTSLQVQFQAAADNLGDAEPEGEREAPAEGKAPAGRPQEVRPAPPPAVETLVGGARALRYITEVLAGERVRQLAYELALGPPSTGAPAPSEAERAAVVERALRTLQIEFHRVTLPPGS